MGNHRYSQPIPNYTAVPAILEEKGIHSSHQKGGCSEKNKGFLDVTFDTLDFLTDNVEANSLGDWSALAYSHHITNLETESWGAMARDGLMTFLESVVLLNVVEEITADNNGPVHFS